MKTDIIQIADIPNVKEPVQVKSIAEKIEVQQCRLSVSYKCGNCRKGIEPITSDSSIVLKYFSITG
jgi:hypothetical protein